jgi:GT2 family glycosyltransferase
MPEVSIIILTYNSSRFIVSLLESLKNFGKGAEVIVVDNNSKDETVKLAKKFKDFKVIETGKNLGFAKGINFGAKKSTGKYLLFINPDAVFKNGEMSDLISHFKENEKIGVIGGKLISNDGKPENSAGKFFNLIDTLLIVLGLDEILGVRYSPKKFMKVDFVSGGFMMVRSDLFKRLGGFDENFFMYVEDMEFCYRVKKTGFNVYFSPDVAISHAGQGSSNRGFAIINIYKGILYFFKKHKNPIEYWMIRIALLLKAFIVYSLGIITNNSYYKKTYWEAISILK